MKKLNCDVVFHTAAYKHVPMMEDNPVAAIENNVFGTKNLLDACVECNVKRFVLISTDKAVSPISVYGFSKMLNEKMVLDYAKKTRDSSYMFVRFGNVLGSRGSIFPLFVSQIEKGGPVTITDMKMIRYFMTIPEACSLVLQTGGVGTNGSSYLLDMGEPVNIYETAKQLIRYMGYVPEVDIPIQIIGKRKGERLEEYLYSKDEEITPTKYPKILKLQNNEKNFPLDEVLDKLAPYCIYNENKKDLYRNREKMVNYIKENFLTKE
jgi:capsular polysaccharide biosynthesis protein